MNDQHVGGFLAELSRRIESYKLLDTMAGQLDLAMRIEHELIRTRYSFLRSRQKSTLARVTGTLVALAAAGPALYTLVPEAARFPWIAAVLIFGGLYLWAITWNAGAESEEAEELKSLMPHDAMKPLGHRFDYISTQISTAGTRLLLADAVVAMKPPDEVRERFEEIISYWEAYLDRREATADELHKQGALNDDHYERIKEWLSSARRGRRETGDKGDNG